MSSGYAILVNGGDLGFTTDGTLSLTDASLTGFSLSGMTAALKNNSTLGSFTFDSFSKPQGVAARRSPQPLTSPFSMRMSTRSLAWDYTCTFLNNTGGCSTTGYATTGNIPVPEPSSISFVGVSLLAFVGVIRRRFGS